MLVKFFSNKGGGSAKASVDYLLDKPDNMVQILQGDPRLSQKIAESLKFATTYTVGALSFEEKNLDETQKHEIMAKFERVIFSGLSKEQYNISWIEHTDKNRLELNFFIPNVELTSGKRLQPYYDKADRPLVENFKQVINHQYNLSDPNSPDKKQIMINRQDLPKNKQEALNAITDGFIALATKGMVNDRKDVISVLERSGFEIARITSKSISIKAEGQNLRLKGAFYEEDFRIGGSLSETVRERTAEYQRTNAERYQTARTKLMSAIEHREREFQRKYPNRAAEIDRTYQNDIQNSFNRGNSFDHTHADVSNLVGDYSGRQLPGDEKLGEINRTLENTQSGDKTFTMHNRERLDETLHSNRSDIRGENMDEQSRGSTESDTEFRIHGTENNQQEGQVNGDTNRNSFADDIREIIRAAVDRASGIIDKIREIGERIFGNTEREQINSTTIQRNNQSIGEVKQYSEQLENEIMHELRSVKEKVKELV